MKFKKSESGRSMVEMLGVLAIIGVLSVGGIAGYSLSMRRHRANQVVDYASKYSLLVYDYIVQDPSRYGGTGSAFCSRFGEADLGKLPVGVGIFGGNCTVVIGGNNEDFVEFSAQFDDDKLCQAVGSIMGTGCEADTVQFKFKYN